MNEFAGKSAHLAQQQFEQVVKDIMTMAGPGVDPESRRDFNVQLARLMASIVESDAQQVKDELARVAERLSEQEAAAAQAAEDTTAAIDRSQQPE